MEFVLQQEKLEEERKIIEAKGKVLKNSSRRSK
jgi:hypothetical protein